MSVAIMGELDCRLFAIEREVRAECIAYKVLNGISAVV
jgi:hypothetical protein